MHECYKFFGLGPNFINMLQTVSKNRLAAFLLDKSALPRTFLLGTGRPQGNNLSPTQYNVGQQINFLGSNSTPILNRFSSTF